MDCDADVAMLVAPVCGRPSYESSSIVSMVAVQWENKQWDFGQGTSNIYIYIYRLYTIIVDNK